MFNSGHVDFKVKSSLVNEKTKGKIVSMKCERLEKDLKVEKTKKLEYLSTHDSLRAKIKTKKHNSRSKIKDSTIRFQYSTFT